MQKLYRIMYGKPDRKALSARAKCRWENTTLIKQNIVVYIGLTWHWKESSDESS
jgi:hypothetical protein